MITITFFGHRLVLKADLRQKLYDCLNGILKKEKNIRFLIGTHGEFDSIALSVCRELRRVFSCKITVVFTSLSFLQKKGDYSLADFYKDVETLTYDIENVFYKKRIAVSNQKMVDESDVIVCYVDMNRTCSGAKKAVVYGIKKNKKIINLF